MAAILQTTLSNIFSWMKMLWFQLKFHSIKFVPKVPINNISALVQIMACRLVGDKPLSEPMMVRLLMHICITPPQWVNCNNYRNQKLEIRKRLFGIFTVRRKWLHKHALFCKFKLSQCWMHRNILLEPCKRLNIVRCSTDVSPRYVSFWYNRTSTFYHGAKPFRTSWTMLGN